jgi:DME family drug/metabolite transporter
MASPSTRNATLALLLAALLWSTGGLGVESASGDAMTIAGTRSLFAIPVLGLATWIECKRRDVDAFEMMRRPLMWAAAFSYAVMVVCFVVSAKLTFVANTILLQYSGPIYVALGSWPLLRERIRPIDWVATAACFVGMLLFFMEKLSPEGMVGNGVAILSSFGFAGVPLFMRLEQRRRPAEWRGAAASPYVAMLMGNVLAVVVCLPRMIAAPLSDARSWTAVALLGVVQIGIAYWLYGSAVGKMPALRSTLLATIEPVLNPLWVILVKHKTPSKWAVLGGAVIVLSVTGQAIAARTEVKARRDLA